MIDRLNILELFGADKNKYHSCIITCYSFDFIFFEQRVLPILRRAGMININIFVDARMYQQQLSNLDGNYILKQSYSITPIKMNGAFHPKILMGIGKNNGFLAIGSGNITNSGLSSNDEVWGAFHTFKDEGNALPLFKTTFEYLQNLKPFCYGSNYQKWDWIEKNTNWLDGLKAAAIGTVSESKNEELTLLNTFGNKSIYEQLLEKLPKSKLENLTIISPFYNKRGDIITRFIEDLKPEKIDVVVDDRYGTVPYQFTTQNNVQFHQWEVVKKNDATSSSMLHAKIFQFKYKNETCILTGSANATTEAFGTNTSNSRNAEMSLFIKTNESKNWVKELEIEIPEIGTYNIYNYNSKKVQLDSNVNVSSKEFTINYVELDVLQLYLYVEDAEKIPNGSKVAIENSNGSTIFYLIEKNDSDPISLEISELSAEFGFKVYIVDTLNNRISDFGKIHNQQLLQRTNPDAKSTKFLDTINGTELRNYDFETLLEFANFDDVGKIKNASSNVVIVSNNASEQDNREYETKTEEEFNKNEEIVEQRFNSSSTHLTMLEDFLNNMTFKDADEDYSDSSETEALEAKDKGVVDNTVNEQVKLSFHEGQRIRNKLHRTLEKINKSIVKKHNDVLSHLVDNKKSDEKASIENLQALLVGTHLIFMKLNEKFDEERIKLVVKYKTIDDLALFEKVRGINLERLEKQRRLGVREVAFSADGNVINEIQKIVGDFKNIELISVDETPSISIEHSFFQDNPIFSKSTPDLYSKKGFLINTVAPFLLVLINGVKDYNPQELMKFNAFKKRLFYRVLVLVLSLKWHNKETRILELFLLNVFYKLLPDNTTTDDVLIELEVFKNKLNISEDKIRKNEETLIRVLNSYLKWKDIFDNNRKELIKELNRSSIARIIFKSSYGFAVISSNFEGTLNLNTPLGAFNKNSDEYEIKNVRSGLKGIIY